MASLMRTYLEAVSVVALPAEEVGIALSTYLDTGKAPVSLGGRGAGVSSSARKNRFWAKDNETSCARKE